MATMVMTAGFLLASGRMNSEMSWKSERLMTAVAMRRKGAEVVMNGNPSFQRGDLAEARRIQSKLLEIIKTMFAAGNFPEAFREEGDEWGQAEIRANAV